MTQSTSGFTLFELTLAMSVLTIVALGALSMTVSSASLEADNRQAAIATSAARDVAERMQGIDFDEIYEEFNDDPDDDPRGPGTGLGSTFKICASNDYTGQAPRAEAGEAAGSFAVDVNIRFPLDAAGRLSEQVAPLAPGMPTDLNANGRQDAGSRADDYKYLPCLIEVQWNGSDGRQRVMRFPRLYTKKTTRSGRNG